jgi:predicted MPP superfamily phosphohydrolase
MQSVQLRLLCEGYFMNALSMRDFLKIGGGFGIAVGLTGLTGALYSTGVEPNDILIERETVHLRRLPPRFDGFKVALLSDLHIYPFTTVELIDEAIRLTNSIEPDLVVFTGDFVYKSVEAAFDLVPLLKKLNPTKGVFAVLGNHDHRVAPQIVAQALAEGGVELLNNRGIELQIGSDSIYLAGIDSYLAGRPRPKDAFANRRGDLCSIALVHEPDPIAELSAELPVDLQLSGHSHGGQVRFPVFGPLVLPQGGQIYSLGLYQVGHAQIYTTRGIGTVGLPVRFNCPPEVTAITLRA